MSFRKKTNIKGCLSSIAVAFIMLFLVKNTKELDHLVLLEKKNPIYWNTVSPGNAKDKIIYESLLNYSDDRLVKENLLLSYEWLNEDVSGVTIKRSGNRLFFDGMADHNIWPGVTNEFVKLDQGQYFISADGEHDDIYTYLVSVNENEDVVFSRTQDNAFFTIEDKSYECKFNMAMESGIHISGQYITPIITKLRNDSNTEEERIAIWYITREDWESLSSEDIKLFNRQISYQGQDYLWRSIIFEDNTGIQYIDGNEYTGEVDRFGRVKNI